MRNRLWPILIAVLFGFALGFAVALANGQSLLISFYGGLVLTAVAGILAAPLIWAAEKKGYIVWVGVLMVLLLNVLGLLLLLMLPQKSEDQKQGSNDI